jgi:hypothetical protein
MTAVKRLGYYLSIHKMNHFKVGPYIIAITLISTSLNRQCLYPMKYRNGAL